MTSAELTFLTGAPRFLFFTGKGGVGKTSIACAAALALAGAGKKVLLVSTDPASNVGQVFGVAIGNRITAIPAVMGLSALEIDPEAAAADYRERIVGPVRGLLPEAEIASITEQLAGSCTTEVASFDEFTALLTDITALRERFGVSERRACTVVGLHRSTMRLGPPPITTEEAELRAWLRMFSTERPRWGWRRAAKMARRAGWQVNDKRIRRLWREEGLRVPQRRRKKRLTGVGVGVAVGAMSPIRPNVIWAMDFQFDTTADGRTMKMLNVIDEFTREALAIDVDRGIDADGVVDVLDRLVLHHGAPHYVRFDNGPEFVAHAVNDWCRFNSAGSLFIDPGSPLLTG